MATTERSGAPLRRVKPLAWLIAMIWASVAQAQQPAVQQEPVQPAQTEPLQRPPRTTVWAVPFDAEQAGVPRAWRLDAGVSATLTATSNSGYTDRQQSRSDRILNLEPRLSFARRGGRVRLAGDLSASALHYFDDTQPDRVLPRASLNLESMLVDRWVYLDASAEVDQTASDPYASRPDGRSAFNQITTRRFLVSPRIDHWFTPSLSLLARSDFAWTRRNGDYAADDPRRDSREQQHFVRLEQQPLPLGGSLEYVHQDTRYDGDVDSVLTLDTLRAVVSYAITPQLSVGIVGGREHSEFSLSEHTDSLYGVRLRWQPTERTLLTSAVEDRFFGTGWDLQFTHRMPFLAVHFRSFREPTAQPSSQILEPGGGSVRNLLDAILTTRYPDPVAREELVRRIIRDLNLPETLRGPIEVFADYAQLLRGNHLSVALLGRRTTVAVNLYQRRYWQLTREDDVLAPDPSFASDHEQVGAALDVTRRLTPQTSLGLLLQYSRIEGLGSREDDFSRERIVRVTLQHQLSPDTAVTLGARRQLLRSNVSSSAREAAAFVGVSHSF